MTTNSKEYARAYYEKNKEKYNKLTHIICICGMKINRTSKSYHVKTKNHFHLLEQKNMQST